MPNDEVVAFGEGVGNSEDDAKNHAVVDAARSLESIVRYESEDTQSAGSETGKLPSEKQHIATDSRTFVRKRMRGCEQVDLCRDGDLVRSRVRCNKIASQASLSIYVVAGPGMCATTDKRSAYSRGVAIELRIAGREGGVTLSNDEFCNRIRHAVETTLANLGFPVVADVHSPHGFVAKLVATQDVSSRTEGSFLLSTKKTVNRITTELTVLEGGLDSGNIIACVQTKGELTDSVDEINGYLDEAAYTLAEKLAASPKMQALGFVVNVGKGK